MKTIDKLLIGILIYIIGIPLAIIAGIFLAGLVGAIVV